MTPFKFAYLSFKRKSFSSVIGFISLALSIGLSTSLFRIYLNIDKKLNSIPHMGDALVSSKPGGIDAVLNLFSSHDETMFVIPQALFESLQKFKDEDYSYNQSIPSFIEEVVPFLYAGNINKKRVFATNFSFFNFYKIREGKFFLGQNEIVLGSSFKKDYKLYDKIKIDRYNTKPINSNTLFTVVGFLEKTSTTWDETSFIKYEDALLELNSKGILPPNIWKDRVLNFAVIKLKGNGFKYLNEIINDRSVAVATNLNQAFLKLHVLYQNDLRFVSIMTLFILFLGSTITISILLLRFDVMKKDITMLWAFGINKKWISQFVLAEAFIIFIFAFVFSLFIDFIFYKIFYYFFFSVDPLYFDDSFFLYNLIVYFFSLFFISLAIYFPLNYFFRNSLYKYLRSN